MEKLLISAFSGDNCHQESLQINDSQSKFEEKGKWKKFSEKAK